ncbi:hypothetical protein CCR75_003112 [Bremia lactucae]|uniref:C3H1-type domain-containing protein n=1 Tax=Bremia lactucae TaxID=4779 RepID=A0A976FI93_BRELC|nr:hypothetical protein CCR75_003112 [Bremia lactucae]
MSIITGKRAHFTFGQLEQKSFVIFMHNTQRVQVAMADNNATAGSRNVDQRIADMPRYGWLPAPMQRSYAVSNPSPDCLKYRQVYRNTSCDHRYSNNTNQKYRKVQKPCVKFRFEYGCSFGNKCRYSHDLRPFYSDYYEYHFWDELIWSEVNPMPRQDFQNCLHRQISHFVKSPPRPTLSPEHQFFSTSNMPKREHIFNFSRHYQLLSDDARVVHGHNFLCEEAILMENNMKQSKIHKCHELNASKATRGLECSDDYSHPDIKALATEGDVADKRIHTHENQWHNNMQHSRKYAASDERPNAANGNSADCYFNLKRHLSNQVDGSGGLSPVQCAKQLCQGQEQRYDSEYANMCAVQQMQISTLPYTWYLVKEQFYSNLSRQVEEFVQYVDTTLATIKRHKQQAVDFLQGMVRTLWPDAVIDVYGSSYTGLALPVSDIDCVLVSRSLEEMQPLAVLEVLAAEVERRLWMKKVELLRSAKIPVLKMTYSLDSTEQEVLLDLTCGHSAGHTGIEARDYIYSLKKEMPALRPLVMVLKEHLVCKQLNAAYTGGISSYVLVVLVARFLQACGGTHETSFVSNGKLRDINSRRSYSESACGINFSEEDAHVSNFRDAVLVAQPRWCYTFSRGGHLTWQTDLGSLLMLFLETYIMFDYRRFGISIKNEGSYFVLPPDKIVLTHCSVVIPFVADPMKPGRNICNCFRMHEVIQSWLELYRNLAARVPIATCIGNDSTT